MKIIIIWTDGTVGKKLSAKLKKKNIDVTEITKDNLNSQTLTDELKETDIIIHCASGENINSTDESEYEINKNIINSAKKANIDKFIYLSSMAVYKYESENKSKNNIDSLHLLYPYSYYNLLTENYLIKSGLNYNIFRSSLIKSDKIDKHFNEIIKLFSACPFDSKTVILLIDIDSLISCIIQKIREFKSSEIYDILGEKMQLCAYINSINEDTQIKHIHNKYVSSIADQFITK
jgi:nucleoside-diphosphate-sugar epimerase